MKRNGFTLIEMIVTIVVVGFTMLMIAQTLIPQIKQSAAPTYQAKVAALASALADEMMSRRFDERSDPDGNYRCGDRVLIADNNNTDSKAISAIQCTLPENFGPDQISGAPAEQRTSGINTFNDVDDYVGCWGSSDVSTTLCPELYDQLVAENGIASQAGLNRYAMVTQGRDHFYVGPLADVSGSTASTMGTGETTINTGNDQGVDYSLFTVAINVTYVPVVAGGVVYPLTPTITTADAMPQRTNVKRIDLIIDIDLFGRYSFTFYRGNY